MEESFGKQRLRRLDQGESQKTDMLGESSAERHVGFGWLKGELAQLLADVIRLESTCLNDVL